MKAGGSVFVRKASPGARRMNGWEATQVVLGVGALLGFLAFVSTRLGYHWQWYRVPRFFLTFDGSGLSAGPLLTGLVVTVQISLLGFGLAAFLGLGTALLRLSVSLAARALARGYVELVRNTPLLIQIFFLYFVLSPLLSLDALSTAVLALGLFEGAYASEIFRAGIVSIPRGQWEAAWSLGLGGWDTYRLVILPQALRRVLPALTGQTVSLVKDSALVSTIAIYDLTMQGQAIVSETFLAFEIWFSVAAVYLVMTLALSFVASLLERRLATGHGG